MSVPDIPGLQILKKIGQGGMAIVYLALQESLQRPVAVKILTNPDTPGFHERFINEGRYIAALSHSNIVDVYDVGECDGHYYIVMEYLPGGDLKSRIKKGIQPKLAMEYVIRIASCLDYLHGQGIVHRDLKPANILFRGDGNPVITDFGIAKILQQDQGELTVCGSLMGSPYYLSPEQAESSTDIDGRSDLYSLGIIIYEMLLQQPPFTGDNFAAIIMAHREAPIPMLPDGLVRYQPIIDQLLPKLPVDRYQNGQELIDDIREFFTHEVENLGEVEGLEQGDFQTKELSPRRNSSDRLHFDDGSQWFKRLLLLFLLLTIAGYTLREQQNQEFIALQEKVTGWLPLRDTETVRPTAVDAWQPNSAKSTEKHRLTQVKEVVNSSPGKVQPEVPLLNNEVSQMLRLAYARMDALKLSYPVGDSALHYFREVQKLESDNGVAKAGIDQIVLWYIQQAEQAISDADLKQAASYISRGTNINKQHPRLSALNNQLHAAKSTNK